MPYIKKLFSKIRRDNIKIGFLVSESSGNATVTTLSGHTVSGVIKNRISPPSNIIFENIGNNGSMSQILGVGGYGCYDIVTEIEV